MAQLFKKRRLENKARDFKIPNFKLKIAEIEKWNKSYKEGSLQKKTESQCEQAFNQSFFEVILGYTPFPAYEYTYEPKADVEATGQKPDAVLAYFQKDGETPNRVGAVVEIKDVNVTLDRPQKRKNPETPIQQGFRYKGQYKRCDFVIAANFYDIRLLKDNQLDYQQWTLDSLVDPKDDYLNFRTFYFLLCAENLLAKRGDSRTESLLSEIRVEQSIITKKFYAEYKALRKVLIKNIFDNNEEARSKEKFYEIAVEKSQKIIDRLVFVAFCEDLDLLPENTLLTVVKHAQNSFSNVWDTMKGFFNAVDSGSIKLGIPNGYNGELFKPDPILDNLKIDDVICEKFLEIGNYDFSEDLSVNILGHIFEQSISDLEELKAVGTSEVVDEKKSKRKKDGIFYTPEYIVDYIVRNSVGAYLQEKEAEILEKNKVKDDINDKNYQKRLQKAYLEYREVLKNIKVLDPACGSGAFLVNVFDFLLSENERVGEILGLNKGVADFSSVYKSILQNNIYGVDLNPESVEITKLSLWLKTAQKGKKLATLDKNIKCGNSLIDDPVVAGARAFKWEEEFKDIMDKGGFDIVVGNPPYVRVQHLPEDDSKYFFKNYKSPSGKFDLSILFFELALKISKERGVCSFISSSQWMQTNYGKNIRGIISNGLINIVDFGALPVFLDASTYPAIFNFSRKKQNKFIYKLISKTSDLNYFGIERAPEITVNTSKLNAEPWNISGIDLLNIIDRNKIQFSKLGKVAPSFIGALTGMDKAFVVNKETIESENLEKELILPYGFRGDEISSFCKVNTNYYVIYPYENIEGKTILIDEKQLSSKYPNILSYLSTFKEDLQQRLDSRKKYAEGIQWYRYLRPGNFEYIRPKKLLIKGVSKKMIVGFLDEKSAFNGANCPAVIPFSSQDINYFIAILNSKLITYFLNQICPKKLGGYFRYNAKNIASIPVIQPSANIRKLADNLVSKISKDSENKIDLKNKFFTILKHEYQIDKIPRKLQKHWELDFDEFVKQLKIKKLSLDAKSELLDFFEKNKSAILELKTKIDTTDRAIDQMVFDLYGLTEKEVEIVLNN